MMIPTVHLNGTSQKDLLDETYAAARAVEAAIVALRQVTVHGRDYYPQGPDAYAQARHEMDRRLTLLRDLSNELMGLYEGIYTQKGRA